MPISSSENMEFLFITADPARAKTAQAAGVEHVMVDLEINGKVARQGHLNTVISRHSLDDVDAIRGVLDKSTLTVRTNPVFDGSKTEVNSVVSRGAERLMLPMFRHPDEVSQFIDFVDGRVPVTLLVETATAFARLPQILDLDGISDIHIGLNDLHLELRLDFMFEVFTSGLLEHVSELCASRGIAFGIGGVGPLTGQMLSADLILAEHARLGSTRTILSRAFQDVVDQGPDIMVKEVTALRDHYARCRERKPVEVAQDQFTFGAKVAEIAARIRAGRQKAGHKTKGPDLKT